MSTASRKRRQLEREARRGLEAVKHPRAVSKKSKRSKELAKAKKRAPPRPDPAVERWEGEGGSVPEVERATP